MHHNTTETRRNTDEILRREHGFDRQNGIDIEITQVSHTKLGKEPSQRTVKVRAPKEYALAANFGICFEVHKEHVVFYTEHHTTIGCLEFPGFDFNSNMPTPHEACLKLMRILIYGK